jgi:hypothetical protein
MYVNENEMFDRGILHYNSEASIPENEEPDLM